MYKEVMIENVEKILEREQKVEILVKKTENIQEKSYQLKDAANQIR